MATELLIAVVTASGAIIVTGASYWLTKKREREAELRKLKLEHYKDFVSCLARIIEGEFRPEDQRAFALSCNKLILIARQSVLVALQKFQEEISRSNDAKSQEVHDCLLSKLLYEIRRDLEVKPKDEIETFAVGLWTSGQPCKET